MFLSTSRFTSKKQFILLSVDILILVGSSLLACMLRFNLQKGIDYISNHMVSYIVTGLIYLAFFYIFDLYQFSEDFRSLGFLSKIIQAVAAGSVVNALLYYGNWSLKLGRGVFVLNAFFLLLLAFLWRFIFGTLIAGDLFRHRSMIIGGGPQVKAILDVLKQNPSLGLDIAGFIDPQQRDPGKTDAGGETEGEGIDIEVLKREKIDTLLVDTSLKDTAELIRSLISCSHQGIKIIDILTMYEKLTMKIPFDFIDDRWLLLSMIGKDRSLHDRCKRGVDVILSLLLLALLSPLMLLAVPAVFFETGRPVFHIQERIGAGGKKIRVIKFRSMFQSTDSDTASDMTSDEDKRITPVGRILRRWRVDELPQLLNVLRGDMSLVGPRPEREAFAREFDEKIPFFNERLTVRPGITGWAQVKYGYAATLMEMKEKLMYDLYYIKNRSLWLDLLILLLTVKTVLFGKGR